MRAHATTRVTLAAPLFMTERVFQSCEPPRGTSWRSFA